MICDKNAQMNVLIVSFSYCFVNILEIGLSANRTLPSEVIWQRSMDFFAKQ